MITFYNIVQWLHFILILAIVLGCTLLTLFSPPSKLYIFAFPLSILILCFLHKNNNKILSQNVSSKIFVLLYIIVPLIIGLLQVIIAIYYPFIYNADNLIVREEAINLANSHCLSNQHYLYYQAFPNNLNITILFSIIYRICGSWISVTIVGAFLVNLSAVVTGLTIFQITKSRILSIVTLGVAEFILSFTFIAYPPYSHNFGVLFPILTVFLYTSSLKPPIKILLIIITAIIGYELKITILIPFIAIIIFETVKLLNNFNIKKVFFPLVTFFTLFILANAFNDKIWNSINYKEDLSIKNNVSYFFLLGQSTRSGGRCDGEYVKLSSNLRKEKGVRDSTFYALSLKNISERGFIGNMKFYEAKLNMSFGDASFSSYKTKCRNPMMQKFLNIYIFPRQILWYIILILMCVNPFRYKDKHDIVLNLTIIGIALYLLLFEAESRYVFMFAPLLIVKSTLGLKEFNS